jgi:hypothetical protein
MDEPGFATAPGQAGAVFPSFFHFIGNEFDAGTITMTAYPELGVSQGTYRIFGITDPVQFLRGYFFSVRKPGREAGIGGFVRCGKAVIGGEYPDILLRYIVTGQRRVHAELTECLTTRPVIRRVVCIGTVEYHLEPTPCGGVKNNREQVFFTVVASLWGIVRKTGIVGFPGIHEYMRKAQLFGEPQGIPAFEGRKGRRVCGHEQYPVVEYFFAHTCKEGAVNTTGERDDR